MLVGPVALWLPDKALTSADRSERHCGSRAVRAHRRPRTCPLDAKRLPAPIGIRGVGSEPQPDGEIQLPLQHYLGPTVFDLSEGARRRNSRLTATPFLLTFLPSQYRPFAVDVCPDGYRPRPSVLNRAGFQR